MIPLLFVLILVGLGVGRVKLCGVRFGLAGVLIISLLVGFLIGRYTILLDESFTSTCNFLSSFGTVLFIAVIGLQAGETFTSVTGKKQWKALLGGVGIVMIGALALLVCLLIDHTIARDLLLGLFAGSMTSTPAMSAALDGYGSASSVAVGYGISYWIGLLSIVLFVQMFRLPYSHHADRKKEEKEPSISVKTVQRCDLVESVMRLSASVLIGFILSNLLPIGNTGGVLVSALLIGFIIRKRGKRLCDLSTYKTLGLILFFIGNGITAGAQLIAGLSWCYFLYGGVISALAIGGGYLLLRFVFRFPTTDTLTILCGGMTSTPAIGVLQDRNRDVDLSLYTASYLGALIALLAFVRTSILIWT